jgi:methenyltetrahydromethanopterin cyclohydrolase
VSDRLQRSSLGLNARVEPLVAALVAEAESLRLKVDRLENGTQIIDAGIDAVGGIEAGRRIAEVCLAGLGSVGLRTVPGSGIWSWYVDVHTQQPVMACLGSQYAGWSLSSGKGKGSFQALGSGPARAIGSKEALFEELGYREQHNSACMVIEVDRHPPIEVANQISERCNISADALTLILTPTTSLAGTLQVVARVLEVALHKAHVLEFPLDLIIDGMGSAPISPPSSNLLTAMGRTNDAIIFAGQVHLYVDADDGEAEQLAKELPSSASRDYGKPFAEVFKSYDYDFYQVDPKLFSPARCMVTSLRSGSTFSHGEVDQALLQQSFS